MNIKQLHEKYINNELTVYSYIESIFENIERNNLNSYITLNKENALEKAKELDKKLDNNKDLSSLFGIPVAIKDNILTKDLRTTAASKALENFIPFFDAKIIEDIKNKDAIIIGKTNMDEFAMGGSSETSYFGPSVNAFDKTLSPGGSSSGSATAVAGEEAVISIGTDTGGSVRNPADYNHIVGFAPTYGAISRHGSISMSNSLDRIGIIANNVDDTKTLFDVVRGKSDTDYTSVDLLEDNSSIELKDIKIGYIDLGNENEINKQIRDLYLNTKDKLEDKVSEIEKVEIDNLDILNEVYTVIMSVEVEANIAKVDGLRFGNSIDSYDSTDDFYTKNRTNNFGEEVKRRIALGNYFSSKDNDQKYYKKAMKLRSHLRNQIDDIFEKYDILITPTTIDLPKKTGETIKDSYGSFDVGIFNIITNLSNVPAISIPIDNEKLGSLQIIGKRYDDLRLLDIAGKIEEVIK